jgi:hypothetical protein
MGSSESWAALNRFSLQFAKSATCCCVVPLEGFEFRCAGFSFIGIENAFSPFRSGGAARVGRSAPHLQGRNEVENRNEACVMEVAAMGSRAKLRTKEGGKI